MTPEDDYAYRKADRQLGNGGIWVIVFIMILSIILVRWLAS